MVSPSFPSLDLDTIFVNLTEFESPFQTTMECVGTLLVLENARMGSLAGMVSDPIPTMGEPQTLSKVLPKTTLFRYTSFDNCFTASLCAFRLMTQDFWENLYQVRGAMVDNGDE